VEKCRIEALAWANSNAVEDEEHTSDAEGDTPGEEAVAEPAAPVAAPEPARAEAAEARAEAAEAQAVGPSPYAGPDSQTNLGPTPAVTTNVFKSGSVLSLLLRGSSNRCGSLFRIARAVGRAG